MKHFFAILTTLISLHAQATELFNGSTPKPFQMAQPLAKGSTIGGYPIWDGEEKWKIVHASTYNSSGPGNAIKIGKLGLLQTEDKTFVAYMEVSGNVSAGSNRDWSNEPCKYENLLFKANLGRAFGQHQLCDHHLCHGLLFQPHWHVFQDLRLDERPRHRHPSNCHQNQLHLICRRRQMDDR